MGMYTDFTLEEVTLVHSSGDHAAKEQKANEIYQKMLDEMKNQGINTTGMPKKIIEQEDLFTQVIQYLKKNNGFFFDEDGNINATWYEHDEDMKKVSLHFPNVLIKTHGEGCEHDNSDIWDAWFFNGKMFRGMYELIPPKFDLSKLE